MFRIKICGITRPEDARMAVESGADAIGLNFCRQSPRYLDPSEAGKVVKAADGRALVVGVFVNETPESIVAIAEATGIGAVQLSGDEPSEVAARLPYRVVKAVRVPPGAQTLSAWAGYPCEALLLDAYRAGSYGGTGTALDWKSLPAAVSALRRPDGSAVRWLLAGGLTPGNVREAILASRASGVDVASGVESAPGVKDARKVAEFIQNAKEGLSIAGT